MAKYGKWLRQENLEKISEWSKNGLSNKQIAKNMDNISTSTLYEWMNKYPDISSAIENGKSEADCEVVNTFFNEKCKKTKIREITYLPDENGEMKIAKIVEKEVMPDTQAIIFWMTNRMPKDWKNKREELIKTDFNDDIVLDIKGYLDANK